MEISSLQNPLVKQLKLLGRSSKERKSTNSLLIEGTHALTEALSCDYPLHLIGATPAWQARHSELYAQGQAHATEVITFSESVIDAIATSVNPDGVVAVGAIQHSSLNLQSLALALWQIQDPGNMGTLIRSATAVGIDGLILSAGCVDITNPKILRASAGQWFRCPMAITADFRTALQGYRQQGWQIIASSAQAKTTYWDWNFIPPTILLLGNEGNGLEPELLLLADGLVSVPVMPAVESLNVAIAGSLLMYEVLRQRKPAIK